VGFELEVCPVGIPEEQGEGESVAAFVRRLATQKAEAAARSETWQASKAAALIAADTVVHVDDHQALGKPADAADANAMLSMLVGRPHYVSTAYAIIAPEEFAPACVEVRTTTVEFQPLDDAAIDAYVETGESFGKAGAYAIQGRASAFVKRIEGNWDTVVGLPVSDVIQSLFALNLLSRFPFATVS
jgi:septum formation protein